MGARKKGVLEMKYAKRMLAGALTACLLAGCSGGSTTQKIKLDPDHPVYLTIWHYYNGTQQLAFDRLIEEFNQNEGRESGIFVDAHSQGNVTDLETAVLAAFHKEVGSEEPPDLFSSYADTAYEIMQMDQLVDLSAYLSQEELDSYVDSFIEEGRIGTGDELYIFPTAKSSEIFMLDKTDWDKFAAATGASLDALSTKEGLVETAQAYYEWTDAQTPDIPNDGQAFYGRDAMANLFLIGSMQLGTEMFQVKSQQVTLSVDRDAMRKIWDFYYVPSVKGYFASFGRFRSDDMKVGKLVAYTGSTSSAIYFPDEVQTDDGAYPIECMVLPDPLFEGGKPYNVQQGAGMVVTKSTPEREYAAVTFLKWLTEPAHNLTFGCSSGYLPVKKDALNVSLLDETIEKMALDLPQKTYQTLTTCIDNLQSVSLYTNKAFKNGVAARKVLEYNLSDQAAADRETVLARLDSGMTLTEATADLTSDAAFDAWFDAFSATLQDTVFPQS